MPASEAAERGYLDGLEGKPMASSRAGYPPEYEAAYEHGDQVRRRWTGQPPRRVSTLRLGPLEITWRGR